MRVCGKNVQSAIAAVALVVGCGPLTPTVPGSGSDESSTGLDVEATPSTTGVSPDPVTPDGTDGMTTAAGTAGGDSGPHEPVSFIQDPDGGSVSYECSLWDQNCPAGEKCNVWANDGGNSWNATKCVAVDADPGAPGDPCTVVGSGVSGEDSCETGALCWNVDSETNEGTCVAYCIGSENNPHCPDPETMCNGGREFALCLPICCPLEQDCAHEWETCLPLDYGFQCVPDASGDEGAFGDPCEYINVCDPGLFCASGDSVAGCETAGCCTQLCAVGSPSCAQLDPSMECVPFYEDGQAPPDFEDVGGCLIPQ